MDQHTKNMTRKENLIHYAPILGVFLVISGLLLLLDQRINTKWLSLSTPILFGFLLTLSGFITKKSLWLIIGFILIGVSGSVFIIFQQLIFLENGSRVLWALGIFSVSLIALFFSLVFIKKIYIWWFLFGGLILLLTGYIISLPNQSLFDYVFVTSLIIGISFLIWGWSKKKLGLIIPGLLVSTIGLGVFYAWNDIKNTNGLKETGTMLVWFSLGWALITVASRIFSKKFVWWPLIPGGVLAMVGSGLYIGGNPNNVLGFFQNTGSVALILFGIYLILLKFGMNK
ncbi:MAG: hypothetical protein NTZ74_05980 [Chloroflexi bacterium]|nr:hypothetical protein [Chloroflexota bacterium]